jgi:hypothetical protein
MERSFIFDIWSKGGCYGYPYESMRVCGRPAFAPSSSAHRYIDRFLSGRYEVFRRGSQPVGAADGAPESLGIGDAARATDILEREIPAAWTRAVDGTADDHEDEHNKIFRAVRHEDAESLRANIAAGGDVKTADPRPYIGHMNAPLHIAASINAVLVRILLEAGARVDARCSDGWTPLMRACKTGELEVAALLVGAGADIAAKNAEGYTAYGRIPGTASELLVCMRSKGGR